MTHSHTGSMKDVISVLVDGDRIAIRREKQLYDVQIVPPSRQKQRSAARIVCTIDVRLVLEQEINEC